MINLNNFMISQADLIRKAIEKIDSGSLQIVIVTDEKKKLLGTITDGDVRRAILKGISVDQPARKIMNCSPVIAHPNDSKETILTMMRSKVVRQIPIVDEEGKVVGLEFFDFLIKPQKLNNTVVLMVGGLGTRLRPLTNDCPKPLLKIGNKPILETILERFIEHGFSKFYLSVNFKAEMVKEYFKDGSKWRVQINYLHEK